MDNIDKVFNSIKNNDNATLNTLLTENPKLAEAKDQRGFTPLILATYFDNEAATKTLIKHNVPINDKDASGNTALIGVSFKGNIEFAKFLIENGANLDEVNNKALQR